MPAARKPRRHPRQLTTINAAQKRGGSPGLRVQIFIQCLVEVPDTDLRVVALGHGTLFWKPSHALLHGGKLAQSTHRITSFQTLKRAARVAPDWLILDCVRAEVAGTFDKDDRR